jgi:predicted TPR repeat methyltransferase
MDTRNTVNIFNRRASEYSDKFMDVSAYAHSFDLFCDLLFKHNAGVLDLACGPGNITRYLLGKKPDLMISGIDLSRRMLSLARRNNPTAAFKLMDCRNVLTLGRKFDGAICGFGMPYLNKTEAIQLIADVALLLNDGAPFCFSTMEDDYNKSGIDVNSYGEQIYIYYHEAVYLLEALKKNGFAVMEVYRKTYAAHKGNLTDLVIVSRKEKQ